MAKRSTDRRRSPGEGSVYFDPKKNRWYAASMVDGKRRKVSALTRTEALKGVQQLVAPGAKVSDGNMTVNEVIDAWLERGLPARRVKGRPLAPATIELHNWYADLWKQQLGSKRIARLTVEDVEAALDRLTKGDGGGRSLGVTALGHARTTLTFAIEYAVRRRHVTHNVASIAVVSANARQSRARRSMTLGEAKQFIEAAKGDRLEAMFLIMLTLGLRPGEAAGLTWDAVDLAKGRIQVKLARRRIDGQPVLVDQLKTARSYRTLNVPAAAFEALRLHKINQLAERQRSVTWKDERLVFTASNGALLRPENVRRDLAAITRKAGIGVWAPNELRHTSASILSDDGTPLERIADLFGHVDTRMLERTYRHNIQEAIDSAAPMDRIFWGDS